MCQPGSQGFNSAVHWDHCPIHINCVRCIIPSCRENLTFLQVELESIQLSEVIHSFYLVPQLCRLLVIVLLSSACVEDPSESLDMFRPSSDRDRNSNRAGERE